MTLALGNVTNRGYASRAPGKQYSRDTHANTLADCLADIARSQHIGTPSAEERKNFGECLRSAREDKMQVRYSASWPAPDGQSLPPSGGGWQIIIAVTCNNDWGHRAARSLIVSIDQFTAIDHVLRSHHVQEVPHA